MNLEYLLHRIKHHFVNIIDQPILKTLISPLFLIFKDKTLLLFVFLLIIIDFITGVIKGIVLKEKIESSKFRNTLIKIYVYYSVILTMGIVSYITEMEIILKVTYSFVSLTEAKSILENLVVIHPNLSVLIEKINKIFSKDDR